MAGIGRWRRYLRAPLAPLRRMASALRRLHSPPDPHDYELWVQRYDTLRAADEELVTAWSRRVAALPTFSVHVLGERRPSDAAELGLGRQIYRGWDRVPAEAHATASEVLRVARGEYLLLLDAGTELSPHALVLMARELLMRPGTHALYGDTDDKDTSGRRCRPDFKPDWSPELLRNLDYVDTPLAVHAATLQRSPCTRLHPTDVLLAMADAVPGLAVRHVPYVLGHRHGVSLGTSLPPPSSVLGRRLHPEPYELPSPAPAVSVLIPTRNHGEMLRRCIDSLRRTVTYRPLEIIVVDDGSTERATLGYFEELADTGVTILRMEEDFNYSRLNNRAAQQARGDVLLLLNNDVEAITEGWLEQMVAVLMLPEVGAVGALLQFPDGRVQHAGVVLGALGLADHAFRTVPEGAPGMGGRLLATRECSAVTAACIAVRREVFAAVDGFDEDLPVAFSDVDLCLRIGKAGYRILWTPEARLVHAESASRGADDSDEKRARWRQDTAFMRARWVGALEEDPYYSPNLSLRATDGSLAFPPRVPRAWELFR